MRNYMTIKHGNTFINLDKVCSIEFEREFTTFHFERKEIVVRENLKGEVTAFLEHIKRKEQ